MVTIEMKKYIKLVVVFIASFSLVFVTGILRSYVNFQTSSLLGSIAYFGITWFFLKKFHSTVSEWNILLVILLGLSVLQIPIRIMDWNGNLVSFPDFLFHNIAILIAFLFYKSRRVGVLVSIAYFAFLVFMYLNGYSLYLHYLNFGTLSGNVSEACPPFELFKEDSTKVSNDDFNDKILVLDFWNTGCGVCFRQFPEFEKKFEKYQGQQIDIYSVNVPLARDTPGQATRIIADRHYSFPVLFIHDLDILKKLKIIVFPTTLVITNGKMIVFRGDIERLENFLMWRSEKSKM
jgi:thiol-disulfide isomerase/thioredoxin